MKRTHPNFMKEKCLEALKHGDMRNAEKIISEGMQYWTDLLTGEIGPVGSAEAPLIIAALCEMADAYCKAAPGAGEVAEAIREVAGPQLFIMKRYHG